jgi:AbrB family looped-hinge helix DNA binding protein
MAAAKVTSKGQITVPKAVRERLGLAPGDTIEFVEVAGAFTIRRRDEGSRFGKYRGYLRQRRGQDPDALVDELRGEA